MGCVRDGAEWLTHKVMWFVMLPVRAVQIIWDQLMKMWMVLMRTQRRLRRWVNDQVRGSTSNFWRWITERLHLRDVLIPAIYDTLVWLSNQVPLALGGGTPSEMIEASFVLALAAFLSGFISGFVTWTFLIFFAFTAVLGLLRFIPVVDDNWPVPKWRFGDSTSVGVP